jgi:exopolyphosphatase/guanosine-5'-triphosphate,3'-diphosphate pyrophosphatase
VLNLKHLESYRNEILLVSKKYSSDLEHLLFVEKVSLYLFDKLKSIHKLNANSKTYLSHASLLHDIGHYINEKKHHKHTKYLIENDSNLNFYTVQEKIIISYIARNHRKEIHEKTYLLNPEDQIIVLKLSSILRIADGFDYIGKIKLNNIEILKNKILISISGINNFEYALKRFEKKKDLFEKLFSLKIYIKEQ